VQKCIRTGDIEEVGDSTHHTFFEMMGNWSLGDYFKEESIALSWEFLTDEKYLNLDKRRIAVSVFAGDDDAPFDEESYNIWKKIFEKEGLSVERIAKLSKESNWWGPVGETGPCGPDSEIFYWVNNNEDAPSSFNDDNDSWVEIWNNVFMEYNKEKDGSYSILEQKNVDTGLGLERTSAVLNGLDDNYLGKFFINLISKIEELTSLDYKELDMETKRSMRIVVDHIKAAVMIIGDPKGITPTNNDQGYVVRRLIRRAIRYGKQLGIKKENWLESVAKIVISDYQDIYKELEKNQEFIILNINKEQEKFEKTIEKGIEKIEKLKSNYDKELKDFNLDPNTLFDLYQSYGFPVELSFEEINRIRVENEGNKIPEDLRSSCLQGFNNELKKHQEMSRTASAGKFKGGLSDDSEETVKLHTAAHLLLAALRKVLGSHVEQRGSNINSERLRFDFSHPEKMTKEEIKEVEDLVNEVIEKNYQVVCEEKSLEEAKSEGAMGVFDSKYEERVKVYSVCSLKSEGENFTEVFSKEICGGPHVNKTGDLGHFRIKKESSSSAGVRRIKAILE
jgi:alanyl-tRNA synthetase